MALTIQDASGNDVTVTSLLIADTPPELFSLGTSGFLSTSWYFDTDVSPDLQSFTFPARGAGGSAAAVDPEGWE